MYHSTPILVPGRALSNIGALNRGVSIVATTQWTVAGIIFLKVSQRSSPSVTTNINYIMEIVHPQFRWDPISSYVYVYQDQDDTIVFSESPLNTSRPLTFAAGTIVTKLVSVVCTLKVLFAFFSEDLSLFDYWHILCRLILTGPSLYAQSPHHAMACHCS